MALEEKTYLICNYTTSPVAVSLRDRSFILEAGSDDNPTTYPLTLSEIQHINNTSSLFKIGCLRPTPEDEEFIYSNLRINDWKEILTNQDIEDIIINPTAEKLTKIIKIKNSLYFERVYGVYIGLKNADAPITANVTKVISARYKELLDNKRETEITIQNKPESINPTQPKSNEAKELEELKTRLAAMEKMLSVAYTVAPKDKETYTPNQIAPQVNNVSKKIKKENAPKTSVSKEVEAAIDAEFDSKKQK